MPRFFGGCRVDLVRPDYSDDRMENTKLNAWNRDARVVESATPFIVVLFHGTDAIVFGLGLQNAGLPLYTVH